MRCWLLFLLLVGWFGAASGANARFTGVIVDEDGHPVPGIKVVGVFSHESKRGMGGLSTRRNPGVTDAEGRCLLEGDLSRDFAGFQVDYPAFLRQKKYYQPCNVLVRYEDRDFFGNWLPQDQVVTTIVQRIEHPIPLIVGNTVPNRISQGKEDLFSLGKGKLQYDFMMGDWLPPVGTGVVADVECVLHAEEVPIPKDELRYYPHSPTSKITRLEQWVDVSFPGPDNGAQLVVTHPSIRLQVRRAPEDGYRQYMGRFGRRERLPMQFSCHAFRIRTQRDATGKIVSCYYGKLIGGFSAKPVQCLERWGTVETRYYLNPTPLDRNLEWDRVHNLLPMCETISTIQP